MSVIFNHTFSADKPVYYPASWHTGKTAPQLYQQFKATLTYYIIANTLQYILGAVWVFLYYVLYSALREINRLRGLANGDLNKMAQRRYLQGGFLMGMGCFAGIITLMSAIVLGQPWGAWVLAKGVLLFGLVMLVRGYAGAGLRGLLDRINTIRSRSQGHVRLNADTS